MDQTLHQQVTDWPTYKARWQAWWAGEMHDRVLIGVTAPRAGIDPRDLAVWGDGFLPREILEAPPRRQYTDPRFMVDRVLETSRCTYRGGENVPLFAYGCSVGYALMLGAAPAFASDTLWAQPLTLQPQENPVLDDAWRHSAWWELIQRITACAGQACNNRYFPIPHWGNNAVDTLAALCSADWLLEKFASDRAWTRWAIQRVSDIIAQTFEELWPYCLAPVSGVEGSLNVACSWSPGRTLLFDCDLALMLSPTDFRELPCLRFCDRWSRSITPSTTTTPRARPTTWTRCSTCPRCTPSNGSPAWAATPSRNGSPCCATSRTGART